MAQIKTKEEILLIKKACQITDQIFDTIISDFYFETEIELRDFIECEIQKRKLKPSFPPIVTSGARAGNEIHPQSTDKTLQGFVIIDFGVVYKGYMSDMTRTVFVGTPKDKDLQYYAQVLLAKTTAQQHMLPNMKVTVSDLAAREALGKLNQYFIHTLGHGVGKKIHEAPKIYWKNGKVAFKENMVVTVEPGIYIPKKLGIRIEDTGVITKKGFVPLTQSTQELIVFKKM